MLWIWWTVYTCATLGLLAFGLHAFVLLHRRRRHGPAYLAMLAAARGRGASGHLESPLVLVQIPVFNEANVVVRAMDAVAALDWPRDRLEIQILDDSTDDSIATIDAAAARLIATGVPMKVLRRSNRDGFKAGALSAGLTASEADFVAIFDADFVPAPDFLRRGLPLFHVGDHVACVQGRWGHLNQHHNWLTRAQAVSVDAHFLVQQLARAASGSFLNFNGTAGIWRRAAIEDAGGWSGTTLTEDLDLSYRAQMRGWRILFDPTLVVPAELPPTLGAYKSQQRRWACGSMQCARRFLAPIWRSSFPLATRMEATFHLCGYGVCVAIVLLTLLLPLGIGHLPVAMAHPAAWLLFALIWIAALGPICVTRTAQRAAGMPRASLRASLSTTLLGLGSAANNAIAVLRGLFLPIPVFVRTPKQGATSSAAGPMPGTELLFGAFTLLAAAILAGSAASTLVVYVLFCSSGYWGLCAYWFVSERCPRMT
jgi:cellulose synthase/poly-beta-1,6-N-acetylglucosamine synthase-like glycosyltransferase